MKAKVIIILLCISIPLFMHCSDENPIELIKVLNGTWVEVYGCDNAQCTNAYDSLQRTVLFIDGNEFSSALYKDSAGAMYDTTFSGKISISSDTLQFILNHFREVFFWRFQNGGLLLRAIYSVDVNGNTIADFRSLLWCCDMKKRGFFR